MKGAHHDSLRSKYKVMVWLPLPDPSNAPGTTRRISLMRMGEDGYIESSRHLVVERRGTVSLAWAPRHHAAFLRGGSSRQAKDWGRRWHNLLRSRYSSLGKDLRQLPRKLVNSRRFEIVFGILTCYALFGDDIRLGCTEKPSDPIFDGLAIVCFIAFSFEIWVSCLGKDDYIFSFFFFLDLIATATLIMDLSLIQELQYSEEDTSKARTSRAARIGSKAGRVVRVIRLVRIAKLYKAIFNEDARRKKNNKVVETSSESWEDEQLEDDEQEKSPAVEGEVSKRLSARMTQRTIVLVLLMLFVLPLLRADPSSMAPSSPNIGADDMFRAWKEYRAENSSEPSRYSYERIVLQYMYYYNWFVGNSGDTCNSNADHCSNEFKMQAFWIGFAGIGAESVVSAAKFSLLRKSTVEAWDSSDEGGGLFGTFPQIAQENLWSAWDIVCRFGKYEQLGVSVLRDYIDGYVRAPILCPRDLRPQERERYASSQMTTEDYDNLHFTTYFDKRPLVRYTALMNVFLTLFICVVLCVASVFLASDANALVLRPLELMMGRVEAIRNNPLISVNMADEAYRREMVIQAKDRADTRYQRIRRCVNNLFAPSSSEMLETAILEKTIIKLGSLLALGFGEAGCSIVSETISGATSSSKVNVMSTGSQVDCIIGTVRIKDFSIANVVLQRNVTTFVNQIAEIVHGCVDEFHGAINQNSGEFFLIVWKVPNSDGKMASMLAEFSVLASARVLGAVHRSPVLSNYRQHPGLQQFLGKRCKVDLSFGLHYGWCIQGALGSEYKIDASYVSPSVSVTSHVEAASRTYGVSIVLTNKVVELCCPETIEHLRLMDKVSIKGFAEPLELFTLDLDFANLDLDPAMDLSWNQRQRYKSRQLLRAEKERKLAVGIRLGDVMESCNADFRELLKMRETYTERFLEVFGMGYWNFAEGEWEVARHYLTETQDMLGFKDGPSVALLRFMAWKGAKWNGAAPEDWRGVHKLEDFEQVSQAEITRRWSEPNCRAAPMLVETS